MRSATLLALAFSCPLLTRIHGQGSGLQTVQLDIDLAQRHDISPELYGIFFEEISHAGDGGLYAELVQDRAFDAMALQSGALSNNADRWLITEEHLAAGRTALQTRMSASKQAYLERNASHGSRAWWLQQQQLPGSSTGSHGLADQFTEEVAWTPLTPSTQLSIMRDPGLVNSTAHRKLSLAVSSNGTNAAVGVVNSGYWGIPVDSGSTFVLSMRIKQLKVSDMAAEAPTTVAVSLQSKDGHVKYASTTFTNISTTWQQLSATLTTETSGDAQLAIEAQGGADVALEFVSLLPATNVQAQGNMQNPFPFRADLLQMLRDLKPRFLRMPGGCYVEGGDHLANAFRWKETLGEVSRRPGHLNAIWGYWSTDGLGIFEYMLLAEELKAEPVWVFNSGNSHTEYIPNDKLHPFVEDVLQSIEFVTGSPDSTWGGMRAAMGHPEPWELNFMAIGNEDCGMWQYLENYHTFFAAIRERYPKIQLIADCDLMGQAPQDLWDWHIYTSAQDLFNKQHEFDNAHPGVFASEYAVTHDAGFGNLKAAVAEAAFMTGLERNSPTVRMASYAPLLVNTHNRAWGPDAIVFNTRKAYGIPSYYVQQMFAENMGIAYASSNLKITFGDIHSVFTAASTTCLDSACKQIAIKVINFATFDQDVAISIAGLPAGHAIVPDGEVTTLTASYPEVENSFEHPFNIAPSIKPLGVPGPNFSFTAKGFSVNVLKLKLTDNGCALSHTEA